MMVSLWLVGCTPGVPRLPSQGGAPWFEWKSEHFTLWSDAPPERGRELVVELEFRRRVILDTLHTSSSISAFVIAVRDRIELGEYQHVGFIGSAWDSDNLTGQPGMFFAADNIDDHVAPHEVAHVISHEIAAYQPPGSRKALPATSRPCSWWSSQACCGSACHAPTACSSC